MRRAAAALALLFVLMAGRAFAEATEAPQPSPVPPEQARLLVEALFAAATGTDAETERLTREEMTEEQTLLRNAEWADYRARTLPWLMEALTPLPDADDGELIEPTPSPSPTPEPSPSLQPGAEPTPPVYTLADSYEAFSGNVRGTAYLDLLRTMGAEDEQTGMLITRQAVAQWMAEVDHEYLAGLNDEYACWIYAPDTQIDYPVVHGEDNAYYLHRMFNGEKNSAGTLFIDYRNLGDFQDPNTLIYGHHMRNNSMFGTLTDYSDQAYYEAHPYMLVMNAEEICLIQLFAGYMTSDEDHCYDIAISDEEDMRQFLSEAMRKSDFLSGAEALTTDRLVTLSTCAYAFEDARYIVLGRLLTVWKEEAEVYGKPR